MTNLNSKWMITFDEEDWEENEFGEFNSEEEAQQFVNEKGKHSLHLEWCEEKGVTPEKKEDVVCTVGMLVSFGALVDGEFVIDRLRDQAYEFGGEYAESYLESVSEEAENELTEQLTKVFNEWANKHNEQPRFYNIRNTKEIGCEPPRISTKPGVSGTPLTE